MTVANCEFCKIVRGEEDARVVYSTAGILAFFPLEPAALGHTLVIPKIHVPDIWAVTDDTCSQLSRAVLRVARAIRSALRPDGMNIINSAGSAATQTIFHLHVHLVPRWANDGFGDLWPPAEARADHVEDRVADLIRERAL